MWKRLIFRRAPLSRAVPVELDMPRRSRQVDADHPFTDLLAKLDRIPYPMPHKVALSR